MQSKLTLHINDELIEQARTYAEAQNKSLSQLVADYFTVITRSPETKPFHPSLQSILGILEGHQVDEDDYKEYLWKKHQ